MSKRLIMALALSTVSSVALAQSQPAAPMATEPAPVATPQHNTTTPQAMPHKATTDRQATDHGMTMADSARMEVKFVTVGPAHLMSSKLIGLDVYNNENESLGEIEDLVVDKGNTITGVIVSVGGFLGIGESYVVVDPSSIALTEKDGEWRAFINTSKENLKNAPKFEYKKS